MFRHTRISTALFLLVIVAALAAAASAARADEMRLERQGFFVGFDYGAGGSGLRFDRAGQEYESDEDDGTAAALRLGYAFCPHFSLGLEARAYHHHGDDFDYTIGSSLVMATFYPAGGGFFLRLGVGSSVIETDVPDGSDEPLITDFEEHGVAVGFGLGYDWFVSDHFALGLALDLRGAGVEDFGDFEDVMAGESTLGLTTSYHF